MAKLKASQRNKLPSSTFALPQERKFPIEDHSHAVNALSRASEGGIAAVKAKVRAAVDKKYPELAKHRE
jgi:hypothetical protein